VLLAALGTAVVAAVLVQVGAAKPPASGIKLFDACLQYQVAPTCGSWNKNGGTATQLPGGSTPSLSFTLENDPSTTSSTLGSLQLVPPAGFSIDTSSIVTNAGSPDASTSSSLIELQNLNLAVGASVTVTFQTATPIPCTGGPYTWQVHAKQSNQFLGTGNDFAQNLTTGLSSTITTGCKLVFTQQPADAVHDQLITNTAYDPVADGNPALNVQVAAEDGNGNVLTNLNSGSVALSPSSGTFSDLSEPFVNGVATFATLKGSTVGSGYKLTATSAGFTPTGSGPFRISLDGENCRTTGSCSPFTTPINKNTQVTSSGTSGNGSTFQFIAIDSSAPFTTGNIPSGCDNLHPLGGSVVDESDGRTGAGGTLTFVYAIAKQLVQASPNNGNPFIPICAGAQRLGADGQPIPCNLDTNQTGWVDDTLNSSGVFTGQQSTAQCNPDGFWWGILGTQQDPIPPGNPQETAWQGGSQFRYFTITVPPPWDIRWGG
jgi:hypothetical protein